MNNSNMCDYSLKQEEVDEFLRNILHLTESDVSLKDTDKAAFLQRLITAYSNYVPFQNLSSTCVPGEERSVPSVGDNVSAVFRGVGGRCWALNSVFYLLLKHCEYKVTPLLASAAMPGLNNHMMSVVRDLEGEGDVCLVDVGFGNAGYQAIPLNFDKESPTYTFKFLTVKWVREGNAFIRKDKIIPEKGQSYPIAEDGWEHVIFFDLVESQSDLNAIRESLGNAMYRNPCSKFNITRRILKINPEMDKFVSVVNDKLLVEGEDGKLMKSALDGIEDIIEAIVKYFPTFPKELAQESYEEWYRTDKFKEMKF